MQKIFFVNDMQFFGLGLVLSYDILKWWVEVEKDIEKIESLIFGKYLYDFCFKLMNDVCVVEFVIVYYDFFGGIDCDMWQDDFCSCIKFFVDC